MNFKTRQRIVMGGIVLAGALLIGGPGQTAETPATASETMMIGGVRLDQPSSLVLRSIKSELDGTPDPRVMANAAPALTAEQQAADDAAKEAAAAAARAAAARRTARAPQRENSGPKRQQRSVFISAGGGI